MSKTITTKEEARAAIKRGIDKLADTVKMTLGPKGRNVLIELDYGTASTKDGFTVAKHIELEDSIENIGANMVKAVASDTVESCGDGTSTATLLAQSIYSDGLKNVTAGANPMDLKKGIDAAVEKVVEFIKASAIPIKDNWELIEQVATVSANGDVATAKVIASTLKETGIDGIINLEDSKTPETHVKLVKGMEINQGYISQHFANQEGSMECILTDCYILVTDKEISALKELLPLLKQLAEKQKPLLIIANDVDGEALGTLVVNRIKGNFPLCAIRIPWTGDIKSAMLSDLCVIIGASLISEERGRTLDKITLEDLGYASKIIVTRSTTSIIGGKGDALAITNHAEKIKSEIEKTGNPSLKELHKLRLAKLTGSVGIIYVGGQSEVEIRELKDRMDDALGATRAALSGGIVAGGGVCYLRALKALDGFTMNKQDMHTGVDIIRNALKAPLRQILLNCGKEESGIMAKVEEGTGDYGYNARTEQFENLIQTGIIDPASVLITCIQNAASVSGLLLSTEAIISKTKPNDKEK